MILPEQMNSRYTQIKTIDIKDLGIRKKIDIFIAEDLNNNKHVIFYITQKSRFLQKDVTKIEEIKTIVLDNVKDKIIMKTIIIESPLCSKAKAKLEQLDWLVFV